MNAKTLREKPVAELQQLLAANQAKLFELRVKKNSEGQAKDLSAIRTTRREIARLATVINQQYREEARQALKGKVLPKELRAKKTRALRRALTTKEASIKTLSQQKKTNNFPAKNFYIRA